MYGKVPTGVSQRAKKYGVDTVCIVGSIGENVGDIYDCITTIESCIDHCCPLEEALENAGENVYKAAFRLARSIQLGAKDASLNASFLFHKIPKSNSNDNYITDYTINIRYLIIKKIQVELQK